MDYKLEDLIDVKLLQELQDKLNVIYSFPSAIIDNDGKVLTAVAWQDICTKFHRVNPESEKECIKSDKYILEHIDEANPAVSYKCPHGMIDNATPIIIEGKHYGNFFTGQFFLEQPELEFFKKQATRFGFDEKAYLEAVEKVPVWTREKLKLYLDFIKGFIEIIAGIGLKNLKEIETNKILNQSEARYKAIVECTSDWVWEIDEKGKYCFCSENVENLLGYKAEEILGKTPFDLMIQEDVEKNKKAFFDILAEKNAIEDFENWNLHKDGRKVCLLTNGFPIFDKNGNVIGYKGADKDITERKQAELLLKKKNDEINEQYEKLQQINLELTTALKKAEENENKLRTIFETLTEGVALNKIIYHNEEMVDYEIVQVNNAYYKIGNVDNAKNVIGAKATELYGMSSDYIKEFWKNHKDKSNAVRTEMKSPVEDRWFYISTSPFVNDSFVTTFFDITENKLAESKLIEAKEKVEESEKRFNLAMKASNDGLFDWNLETNEIYYSPAWKKMLGYEDHELPNDFSVWEKNTDPEDVKKSWELQQMLINQKIDRFVMEFKMKHMDGHWVDILSRAEAFFDENGNAVRMVGTHTDVSERKQAELLLAAEKQRLSYILEGTNAGTWEWNITNGETVFNERWAEIIGYTLEELSPISVETWVDNSHPEDIKTARELLDKHFKGELDFYECESRMKHKNGNWIWILDRGKVYEWDEDGQPIKMAGTHQDITDRKLAEENLHLSEKKLSDAMHTAKLGHWELDLATNVFTFNDEFYSLLNTNAKEMGGYEMAASEYASRFLHPDDEYLVKYETEKALKSNDPNYISSLVHRVIFKDGATGFLNVTVKVKRDLLGNPIKTYGVNQDITERKQAEVLLAQSRSELKAIYDFSPVMMCVVDENREVIFANQAFTALTGTEEELLQGGRACGVFGCINAMDDARGCGFGSNCQNCNLRIAMDDTLKNGTGHINVEYHTTLLQNGKTREVSLLGSTALIESNGHRNLLLCLHDITEREKAEEAQRLSEERYSQLIQNLEAGIVVHAPDTSIIMNNHRATEILGLNDDQLRGRTAIDPYWRFVNEEGNSLPIEEYPIIKILKTNKPIKEQIIGMQQNSHSGIVWATVNGFPIINNAGELTEVLISFFDITKRKLAEEAVRKSEAIKNTMVSNIGDVIVIIDKDGMTRYKSPNITKLFGWKPEELIGKNTWDNVHPDDLESSQKFLGTIISEPNTTGTTELRYKRRDGNYVWIEISVINLLHDKDIQGILGNYSEITKRKKSEEELRIAKKLAEDSNTKATAILEGTEDSIWSYDKDYNIIYINNTFQKDYYRAFGVFLEEGSNLFSSLPDILRPIWRTRYERVFSNERFTVVDEIDTAIGKQWIQVKVNPILRNGCVIGGFCYGSNITERKRAEEEIENYRNHLEELVKVRTEELERANDSLQQIVDKEKELNEMKSRFLSTTSHEFRTPLTSVLSSTQLLQRFGSKWNDEKKDEHFNRIITSIDYLTHLLDDILTLNRAESGKIRFNPEMLNLHKFSQECLTDAQLLIKDTHALKLNYNFKSKQKEYWLDPKLMKFIFNNLLSNGIKYSPDGGIVTLNISKEKKYLVIEVSDEGIGIPSDDLNKVFESFYRTKHGEDIAGTGLGLAIVKRAVDLHNGEITIESELNKGTTFTVRIPIVSSN